jgi:hypothetical protein
MRNLLFILALLLPSLSFGQSKSVSRFRADFKESSNMFFYSSTLKMLNTENNPEFADLLKDIEEIRVLNYDKATVKFSNEDIRGLKTALQNEKFNSIMEFQEKGNSIHLYSREKHGKTVGFVAIIDNTENLLLIDLIGSIDVKKFMELKHQLDTHTGNAS